MDKHIIKLPKKCSLEKGFIWFNGISPEEEIEIRKKVRSIFNPIRIMEFDNMIGVQGIEFVRGVINEST